MHSGLSSVDADATESHQRPDRSRPSGSASSKPARGPVQGRRVARSFPAPRLNPPARRDSKRNASARHAVLADPVRGQGAGREWDNQRVTDDAPALWLWLDTESSGLLDSRPAVLEVAWMLSDGQLRQLTPLRQRLTAIAHRALALREWPSLLMPEEVEQMHVASGLAEDWRNGEKIRSVQELDELIEADLAAATLALNPESPMEIHLAGAGVAQFEARLLPAIGSTVLDWCHYRAADSSVAAMTLGVPKNTEVADGLELDVQEGVDVERATTAPHRAAADVRAAYRQVWDLRSRLVTTEGSRA